jgi:hypothetical protein
VGENKQIQVGCSQMIVGCFGQLNGENNRDELKTCGFKVENL